MPERQLISKPEGWDIQGSAQVLGAEATPHEHPLYGAGVRFLLAEGGPLAARVDLYPEHLLIRYRSQSARLDMPHIHTAGPGPEHVRIVGGVPENSTQAALYPTGRLVLALGLGSRDAPSMPVAQQPEFWPPVPMLEPARVVEGEPSPTPAAPDITVEPPAEKANRVVFTGRLGRNVNLRTTANGKVIGRVPLAVHQGEETIWHTILFFDEKASKAAEDLAKGQLVTVIGYKHLREVQGKDGPKQVEEIYAASVQLGQK